MLAGIFYMQTFSLMQVLRYVQTTIASTTAEEVILSSFSKGQREIIFWVYLGIKLKSIPNTISVIVHDLIFATIGIGLLSITRNIGNF